MSLLWGYITRYALAGAAIAAAALLLALGVQTHRVKIAKQETEQVKTAWSAQREQATATALAQDLAYRTEEQRRQTAQKGITDEADRKINALRADAAIAGAVAGRLQQRVAALVAEARSATRDPGTAKPSPPADDAIGVLADLQRRANETAGIMADFADRASIAGQACERSYNALTPVAVSFGKLRLGG